MGKAIPNAEVMVLREDGSHCAPGEPGELVHRGPLVSLGYWNDADKTAACFRPLTPRQSGLTIPELAVWSGDTVRMDDEGYLYFIGRRDDMIKTSGYRVSPTEVEEVIYATEKLLKRPLSGSPPYTRPGYRGRGRSQNRIRARPGCAAIGLQTALACFHATRFDRIETNQSAP